MKLFHVPDMAAGQKVQPEMFRCLKTSDGKVLLWWYVCGSKQELRDCEWWAYTHQLLYYIHLFSCMLKHDLSANQVHAFVDLGMVRMTCSTSHWVSERRGKEIWVTECGMDVAASWASASFSEATDLLGLDFPAQSSRNNKKIYISSDF